MKNVIRLLVFIFTIFVFSVQGQDYILKLNIGINKLDCKDISINNDTVIYTNVADNVEFIISIEDVYGIHFYENKPSELLLLSFQVDTIECVIDSISDMEIYYRDSNRLLHTIEINDVFCILFDKKLAASYLKSFYNEFIVFQKLNYINSPKLIKNSGKPIYISKNISLVNDSINIQIIAKGRKTTDTYALVRSLSSYINKEPADRQKEVSFNEYILSKEGVLREVEINQFVNGNINFKIKGNSKSIVIEQDKESIGGVFFYDYKIEKERSLLPEELIVEDLEIAKPPKIAKNLTDKKYSFDVNAGFGYMLNSENVFSLPQVNDEYLNKLRKGFSFDANLRLFIKKSFGVGIRYNYFHTSNSIDNVLSENINIMFVGGSIFYNMPIMLNRAVFNVDLSIGLIHKNEDFELNNKQYNLKGNTPGVYVSAGLEYFVMQNITVGFSFGLLGGSLEKTDIKSNYDILIDKPNSLTRFDGMVKIKLYF